MEREEFNIKEILQDLEEAYLKKGEGIILLPRDPFFTDEQLQNIHCLAYQALVSLLPNKLLAGQTDEVLADRFKRRFDNWKKTVIKGASGVGGEATVRAAESLKLEDLLSCAKSMRELYLAESENNFVDKRIREACWKNASLC